MKIKFWGTRGLISSPKKETAIYGGNTSCIQIVYKNHLILIDTGFGVTNFGEVLMDRILKKNEELTIHIFFTHYHWDHIQGLPFFHPIYFPSTTLNLYSPLSSDLAMENLDVLFDGSYSPFAGINSMPSTMIFHELNKSITIGDLKVDHTPLDHGWHEAPTFAYKFQNSEESIVIASDHEARKSDINDRFIEFAHDCSLLVHDGQFSEKQYLDKKGWGHSSVNQALDNALASKAQMTLLTHHLPDHSDSDLNLLYEKYNNDDKYRNLNFAFAKESFLYNINPKKK